MHKVMKPIHDATLEAIAYHRSMDETGKVTFVEEYENYFVLCVKTPDSLVRVTHFYDEPTGLVTLYGELLNRILSEESARKALHLSVGHSPFRMAIGEDSELCLRADYDPAWDAASLVDFAQDTLIGLDGLLSTGSIHGVPGAEKPVAIHITEQIWSSARNVRKKIDLQQTHAWIETSFSKCQRISESEWSIGMTGNHRTYTCNAWTTDSHFFLFFSTMGLRPLTVSLMSQALSRNYHIRFFKLCLNAQSHPTFALELSNNLLTPDMLRYFARRMPLYLDEVIDLVPGFFDIDSSKMD